MSTLIVHGDDDQIVPIVASAVVSSKLVKGPTLTQEAHVRAEMVAYLGRHIGEFPANRELLRVQLDRETSRDVVVAILNSLAQ